MTTSQMALAGCLASFALSIVAYCADRRESAIVLAILAVWLGWLSLRLQLIERRP